MGNGKLKPARTHTRACSPASAASVRQHARTHCPSICSTTRSKHVHAQTSMSIHPQPAKSYGGRVRQHGRHVTRHASGSHSERYTPQRICKKNAWRSTAPIFSESNFMSCRSALKEILPPERPFSAQRRSHPKGEAQKYRLLTYGWNLI
jgi:hypothetical protein